MPVIIDICFKKHIFDFSFTVFQTTASVPGKGFTLNYTQSGFHFYF